MGRLVILSSAPISWRVSIPYERQYSINLKEVILNCILKNKSIRFSSSVNFIYFQTLTRKRFLILVSMGAVFAMVIVADSRAANVGLGILKKGGGAVNTVVATQMFLNLVELKSSGIGGGALCCTRHAETDEVITYDGRGISLHDFLKSVVLLMN